MMECQICESKNENNLIYENDKIKIYLAFQPSAPGHIQIFPKTHYSIFEEVPDDMLNYISLVANKFSMILFELLKVHGTNIIIQNGVPAGQTLSHFSVHVIPRRTDDGLKLEWDMKQATPESLESMHRIITEGLTIPAKAEEAPAPVFEEYKDAEETEKKVNYYLKSLERIP
jgi:histidine triad (HIT) family protein